MSTNRPITPEEIQAVADAVERARVSRAWRGGLHYREKTIIIPILPDGRVDVDRLNERTRSKPIP